jgi:hypothetical protein
MQVGNQPTIIPVRITGTGSAIYCVLGTGTGISDGTINHRSKIMGNFMHVILL